MLSGVLDSERAIEVNIAIMRTFVQLRSMLSSNAELAEKLARLEAVALVGSFVRQVGFGKGPVVSSGLSDVFLAVLSP
jgi:hypothetical protein